MSIKLTQRTEGGQASREPQSEAEAARMLADVRALLPTLRARAAETEALRRAPDETIRELAEIGVFKMTVPVEYGGYAFTPSQLNPIFAEIARGCGSSGWVAWVTTAGTQWMTAYSHELQREMFLAGWVGPYQSGAMGKHGPGVARKVEGGYMIKGNWPWSSGCHHTIFHTMGALVAKEDGTKYPIICQVPHEEVEILDDWFVVGMRGSGSNTITLREEVFVPEYRVIQMMDLFSGKRPTPEPAGLLYKINLIQLTTATFVSLGLGLARAAADQLIAGAGRPITFTTYPKQSEAPVTHLQLGQIFSKIGAVEAIAAHTAALVEADAASDVPQMPVDNSRVRCLTAYALSLCEEVVSLCMRAAGASAIRDDNPLQRIMRDVKTATMHGQMNIETAYEDYGRMIVGLPGFQEPPKKPG